jgi:Tetratricopeptide repeat
VNWPVRSGAEPPLADSYSPRPESGSAPASALAPGATVVLTPPEEPGRHEPGDRLPGGTGKTQLAAALGHALWEARAVDLLVWVNAVSRDAVMTAYAQALADIGITEADRDLEVAAARFLAWLAAAGRPWLVVLDDLADPDSLTGLWPAGPAGRVLVTTPRRAHVLGGQGRRIVPIGPFTPREALAYLTARLHDDPGQRTGALDLAADLGCHPLALAHATAAMIDTGANCRDYRRWFADRARRLSARPGDRPPATDVTWSLSLERADQLHPADLARPALVLAAMMDPAGIPAAVLLSHAACSYVTGHRATAADQTRVWDAVNNLYRLGLLTIDPTSEARTILTHRTVRALTLRELAGAGADQVARAASDALAEARPEAGAEHPSLSQALRDNTTILNETAADLAQTSQGRGEPVSAGPEPDAAQHPGEAIAYWEDTIVASTRALGPAHAQTLLARDQLAAAQETAGRLEEAIGIRERARVDRERVLGPSHPETLTSYANLARTYLEAGRLDDAIDLFERALTDREWVLGTAHPDTLAARAHLARAYQQAGRLKEAVAQYERTLADCERTLGPGHPLTLRMRDNLSAVGQRLSAAGRLDGQAVEPRPRAAADGAHR